MDRRTVLALACAALAVPQTPLAQAPKRVFRIATLDDSVESARAHLWQVFRNRLRELVLAEGKDVAYEARYARGDAMALPALAAELVALKPDLIACTSTPSTIAAMKATASIPVVFLSAGDPVATGLVASLARPGGNVTGTSILTPEFASKQFELLRELVPAARRLAYLTNTSSPSTPHVFHQLEERARQSKLSIRMLGGRQRDELERSFATIKRERIQGLIVGASGTLLEHRSQIVQFMAREKLPAVYASVEYVEAGGLLAFSSDLQFAGRRSAEYAHRILNGARPMDLPVEQVSTTRTLLNLKTARALGIKIPGPVRMRADEVIE